MPYDREIVSNKVAYFASNIQLVMSDSLPDAVPKFYDDMEERAGYQSITLTQAKYCVDQGTSYMMCWVNTDGEFKVRPLHAHEAFVEYDLVSGNPVKAYRYFL